MMHKKIAVTLPADLLSRMERERRAVKLNRSAFVAKSIALFLGIDTPVDQKWIKKYGPIYKALGEEDKMLSKEMMSIAKKTIPKDF